MKAILLALLLVALTLAISPAIVAPQAPVHGASILSGDRSGSDNPPKPAPLLTSGITGNISIANIQPLCTLTGTVPSPNTKTEVVVTDQSNHQAFIPVSWSIIDGCQLFGTFNARLTPGTYSLTLSYCLGPPPGAYYPPGCPNAACGLQTCDLPLTVVVETGKVTPVRIGITTGIY